MIISSGQETLSKEYLSSLIVPAYQRQQYLNAKRAPKIRAKIQASAMIPGIVYICEIDELSVRDVIHDGQQRTAIALTTAHDSFTAHVIRCRFETVAEAAEDYEELNSKVVNHKPDEMLKASAYRLPRLLRLMDLDFLTYSSARSGAAKVSVATALRAWRSAASIEAPIQTTVGVADIARTLSDQDVDGLTCFLRTVRESWGALKEHRGLYNVANLTITMWLYRMMVELKAEDQRRCTNLSLTEFSIGMQALVSPDYLCFLRGKGSDNEILESLLRAARPKIANRLRSVRQKMVRMPNFTSAQERLEKILTTKPVRLAANM